jgi:hypothetical protein
MNARSRLALLISALPLLTISLMALEIPRAVITLGTDPEPPDCVGNPAGEVTISWNIDYSTTADHVYYKLTDPFAVLVEDETYAGDSGVTVSRVWTVPDGAADGVYWAHVEYWSTEIGLEAFADVAFLVCGATPLDEPTWGAVKDLYRK